MHKHKLAVVLNQFGQYSEVFLFQLFRALQHYGKIKIYVLGKVDKTSPWYKEFEIVKLPEPFSIEFVKYFLQNIGKGFARESLRKQYFHYLLQYMPESDIYFPFLAMTREFRFAIAANRTKRVFTSVRGTDVTVTPYLKPEVIKVYREIGEYLYKIHFLSEELMQRTKEFGIPVNSEQVIYQGVNLELFHFNGELKTEKLRILSVGRLHHIKGMEFALLAVKELKKRGVPFELNIIGDGPEKEKLAFLIHDLGLHNEVFLRGSLEHAQTLKFFQESNVYLHPHLVTGLSNTMLEALASNLRVVVFSSNLHLYQEVSLSGLIREVTRYNYKALADELEAIWGHRSFGYSFEEIKPIRDHFSLATQTSRFVNFFEWN